MLLKIKRKHDDLCGRGGAGGARSLSKRRVAAGVEGLFESLLAQTIPHGDDVDKGCRQWNHGQRSMVNGLRLCASYGFLHLRASF